MTSNQSCYSKFHDLNQNLHYRKLVSTAAVRLEASVIVSFDSNILLVCLLFRLGYSRKIAPPPNTGGWISRLFLINYRSGFSGFFDKILVFTQISRTNLQKCPIKNCKIASGIP